MGRSISDRGKAFWGSAQSNEVEMIRESHMLLTLLRRAIRSIAIKLIDRPRWLGLGF